MERGRKHLKWFKHHLSYSWWKYVLIIGISVLGVDMLFATTAYRSPEDKKIEVYVLNDFVTTQTLQDELEAAFLAQCPDQEELTVTNINLSGNDTYAYMQFSTYVAAHQGDVCLMPESEVKKLAADGADDAFLELTPFVSSGVIDTKGIDLSSGMFKSADGTTGLYAIPADELYGMLNHGNDPADTYLVLFSYGGNDVHAAMVANMMIERFYSPKPQGYDELHRQKESATIF